MRSLIDWYGLGFVMATVAVATASSGPARGQPPAVQPPLAPTPSTPENLASVLAEETPEPEPDLRLAGIPNMFGDFFTLGGQLKVADSYEQTVGWADLPLASACRRVKIAENNQALPQDRIHFMYNHFHNAVTVDASRFALDPAWRSYSIDRYTFGVEKTLLDSLWSVEFRAPFAGEVSFETADFSLFGGHVGNLAVLVKRLVYECDATAVSLGLGIDTPTGSDVEGAVNSVAFTMHNHAVHLMPFVAITGAPNPCWFYHAFLQVDVPANGNPIDYVDYYGSGTLGTYNEQTLLYLDVSLGRWWYRNPCARVLTGLAGLVELHYTTALQDSDLIYQPLEGSTWTRFWFTNLANRVDELNLTAGLHAELAHDTVVRTGAVVPLRQADNREFDAELQVQIERRF